MRGEDNWQAWGRCTELGVEEADRIFYPEYPNGRPKGDYTEALAVCSGCVVKSQCLEMAMKAEQMADTNLVYGVFGGLTPPARRLLHRQRRAERDVA